MLNNFEMGNFARIGLAVVSLMMAVQAQGQLSREWNNTTGTPDPLFQATENWTGNAAPDSNFKALFNQSASYEVWWDASTQSAIPSIFSLEVVQGSVDFINKDTSQHELGIVGSDSLSDITINGNANLTIGNLHINNAGGGKIHGGSTINIQDGGKLSASGSAGFDIAGTVNLAAGTLATTYGYVGSSGGSAGVANLNDASSIWSASEIRVGDVGDGTLNVNAGTVDTFTFSSGVDNGATGLGDVTVSGSGQVSTFITNLGIRGTSSLNINSGGTFSTNFDSNLGSLAGANGSATVSGSGSNWSTGNLHLGKAGTGTLTVNAGAVVTSSNGYLAEEAGGTGTATIGGVGSQWNLTNGLYVGGNSGTQAGLSGSLSIVDGGAVSAGDTKIYSNSTLQLSSNGANVSSFSSTGTIQNFGTIHATLGTSTIAGDVVNNGTIQVDSGSGLTFLNELSGSGPFTGDGEVTFQGDLRPGNSPATIEFGGDVTLDATSTTFIEIGGLTTADFDRLVLNNLDAILTINSNAQLDVQLINGFSLDSNQEFLFGDIAGTNAPVGTFSGLGEGALVGNFGGFDLFISYSAGTGNDMSFFTSVPEPGALVMFGLSVGLAGFRRRRRC